MESGSEFSAFSIASSSATGGWTHICEDLADFSVVPQLGPDGPLFFASIDLNVSMFVSLQRRLLHQTFKRWGLESYRALCVFWCTFRTKRHGKTWKEMPSDVLKGHSIVLPLTLQNWLNVHETQFPHLQNWRRSHRSSLPGLLQGLK